MHRLSAAAAALLTLTACLPALTTLQRTTTLAPGERSYALAIGALLPLSDGGTDVQDDYTPVPSADVAFRVGLWRGADIGVRVGLDALPVVVDLKLQLVRNAAWELAIAPGAGTTLLALLDPKSKGAVALHGYLPLLAGIRAGDHRLVFGVKYIGTYMALATQGRTYSAYYHVPGAVLGADFALGPVHLLPTVDGQCFLASPRLCFAAASLGILF